jgi:hypothetical protein
VDPIGRTTGTVFLIGNPDANLDPELKKLVLAGLFEERR